MPKDWLSKKKLKSERKIIFKNDLFLFYRKHVSKSDCCLYALGNIDDTKALIIYCIILNHPCDELYINFHYLCSHSR